MVGVSWEKWQRALIRLLQDDMTLSKDLRLGRVSQIMQHTGIPDGRSYMSRSKIKTIIGKHPETKTAPMRLPELLDDPDVIIKQNRADSDFRIVTSAKSKSGAPIFANLKVDGSTSFGHPGRIVMMVYGWTDA